MTANQPSITSSAGWERLVDVRHGIVLGLITLLVGFGLGIVFGLAEDDIKQSFRSNAEASLAGSEDSEKAAGALASKSWTYMKRAHLHANGLGTASLAICLLMTTFSSGQRYRFVTSLLLGLGALGYSLFWLLAAVRAPEMGSTSLAKESLRWLAMPTSVFCVLGVVFALGLAVRSLYRKVPN